MGITIILQLPAGDILLLPNYGRQLQGLFKSLAVVAVFTALRQDLILHRAIPVHQVILAPVTLLLRVPRQAAVAAIVEAAAQAAMAAEAAEGDNRSERDYFKD